MRSEWPLSLSHWGAFRAFYDGADLRVAPFERDPEPSPLLASLPKAVLGSNRIARPAIREGFLRHRERSDRTCRGREHFVEVDWDVALDMVAGELQRVRQQHGSSAIFNGGCGWASAGIFHHARNQLSRLLNLTGGYTRHLTNYSFGAGMVALQRVIGTDSPLWGSGQSWESIAAHCSLMVCFGGLPSKNLQVESGGCAEHLSRAGIRRAAEAGVEFVNVSPLRRDLDAVPSAGWIAVNPGTDTALMLSLIHEIVSRGRHDREFLDTYCVGFDRLWQYVQGAGDGIPKSARWAAEICGVAEAAIADLARRMTERRTFLNVSWSLQRAENGEQAYWAAIALACVLGSIGLPGGGIGFGYGSIQRQGTRGSGVAPPRLPSVANPVEDAVPASLGADLLLNPGKTIAFNGRQLRYPDIRLQYLCGSNPFHHQQDLNKLLRGWSRLETIITQDPWWTATARHSDIVLPATTALERNDIGSGSMDRYLIAMHRVLDPVGQSRNDFDVLADVAERLGVREAFTAGRDERLWLEELYGRFRRAAADRGHALPVFEDFWTAQFVCLPPSPDESDPFLAFRRDPEAHPLATPSKRIELYSEAVASMKLADCPGHPYWVHDVAPADSDRRSRYPLHLLSNQPANRLHSQLDPALHGSDAKVCGREPILLNVDDAAARGVASGDLVRVFNERGQCLAGVRIETGLLAGVAVMSTGAWFDPLDPGTAGSLDVHGNPNVLTHDRPSSGLAQGSAAQSVLVQVERWSGSVPPLTVHCPPSIRTGSSAPVRASTGDEWMRG